VKSDFYRNTFHNILLKYLLFLLYFVQLLLRQLSHAFPLPKEVWIAQAQPPSPITGKALQNLVPLMSQEENLPIKEIQEPEEEDEDIGLDP